MRKIALVLFVLLLFSACSLLPKKEEIKTPPEIRQWAVSAKASSAYGGLLSDNRDDFSPYAAAGAPDVFNCSDNPRAWVADGEDIGEQWLELGYENEVYVSGVSVRETFNPGAVTRIDLLDGTDYVTIWEGKDTNRKCPGAFEVSVREREGNITRNMTSFRTGTVKITLDTDKEGWNEIDAVELRGYENYWYFFNNTLVIK